MVTLMDSLIIGSTICLCYDSGLKVKVKVMSNSLQPHGLYSPWNSAGQNTRVDSLSLLQGIFPTQGLNPGLPHCRQILYQLSHKGSTRILEWVAYLFSSGSSWPRNWTGVSLNCRQILYQLSSQGSPPKVRRTQKTSIHFLSGPRWNPNFSGGGRRGIR